MAVLDQLDRRILYELDLNARAPASELAKKLRRSKETVNFRINRLLSDGYLKSFYTIFSNSKMGRYYFKMFVKLRDISPKKAEMMLQNISKTERVAYLASTDGYYDCVILVMVQGSEEMESFLHHFMEYYGEYVLEKEIMVFPTAHRFNARFLYAGNEARDWTYPIKLGAYQLDEIDKGIIRAISNDARAPIVKIAKAAGVDQKTASYRLKKLERDGIILAYVTAPNFEKLGLQFVQINFSLRHPKIKKQVIEFFRSTNTCLYAMEVLGKFDLGIEIHVKDAEHLREILRSFREKFEGKYNSFDVATITKEYTVIWGPFGFAKA
ncbi:putative HTH-type transcriptional regulator [uncultured archaeon]|nr:putative HTH-type transcriptional regulator [uncultured archaeon]